MLAKTCLVQLSILLLALAGPAKGEENKMTIDIKSVTPVLFVDKVEPCLEFWERLGFQRAMEVPDGDSLAFAAVHKDGVEIMYQSMASAMKDPSASPSARQRLDSHAFLYVQVADLDPILAGLQGIRLEVEKHTTFYGATEIVVRDPWGHFITFAQFKAH